MLDCLTKFDAPNALARAVKLSNDLSVDEILNFVDNSELIRVNMNQYQVSLCYTDTPLSGDYLRL